MTKRKLRPQKKLAPRNPLDKQNTVPAQVKARPIKVPPTNLLMPTSNNKNFAQQNLTRDWDPTELFEAKTAFTLHPSPFTHQKQDAETRKL